MALTSSPQTLEQVSANDHMYNLCRTACWLRYLCMSLTNFVRLALLWTSNNLSTRPHTKLTFWPAILNIGLCDIAHCQVCCKLLVSVTTDAVCSMLVPHAMRQVYFYLLCEKCCWMTYRIWLWVQWVHQLSCYFVYVISSCCDTAQPFPDPAPTPSVPAASSSTRPHARRHCGSTHLGCPLSRWKFCWTAVYMQSLRNWSHWKIRTAEKLLNWLKAAVNQQTCWIVTAYRAVATDDCPIPL